jgi:hypothetical protein
VSSSADIPAVSSNEDTEGLLARVRRRKACAHARTHPGPRVGANWGSWATDVCECGAWRIVGHGGPEAWRVSDMEERLREDEARRDDE